LIQTIGRAARHQEGRVVMYADRETGSMERAIDKTNNRRGVQEDYNKKHGITPTSISRAVGELLPRAIKEEKLKLDLRKIPKDEYTHLIRDLTSQMDLAAANLEFEKAADLRDLITEVKAKL
jgi:excinuclease ABC subunit B